LIAAQEAGGENAARFLLGDCEFNALPQPPESQVTGRSFFSSRCRVRRQTWLTERPARLSGAGFHGDICVITSLHAKGARNILPQLLVLDERREGWSLWHCENPTVALRPKKQYPLATGKGYTDRQPKLMGGAL